MRSNCSSKMRRRSGSAALYRNRSLFQRVLKDNLLNQGTPSDNELSIFMCLSWPNMVFCRWNQVQSDLRAIGMMAIKTPPTTNHHRGHFGNVHRDDTRRHDDLFLVDDDLCGHRGDVHIEWDESWRPIPTPKPTPPITSQTALWILAGRHIGFWWHLSSAMETPPTRPQRDRLSIPKRVGRSRSDFGGSGPFTNCSGSSWV